MVRLDAIVLGLGGTGLQVARALGRRGLRVAGVDPRRWEIGHRSRYLVRSSHASTAEELIALAGDERPLLLACGDPQVAWADRHAAALRPHVRAPSSLLDGTSAAVLDKRRYYARCRELAIPLPRTWIPGSMAAVRAAADEARYPVVVKPALAGASGRRPRLCDNATALIDACPAPRHVVIQEWIAGPDDALWVYAAHRGADGRVGPEVVARKLRQYPDQTGSGCRVVTARDDEVREQSRALVASLGLVGPCGVEWKRGPAGLRHIETNARPVLWYGLADEVVWDAWCDLTGAPRPEPRQSPPGVVWQYRVRDRVAARSPRPTPADLSCIGAPDDPLPGLLELPYSAALWLATRLGRR